LLITASVIAGVSQPQRQDKSKFEVLIKIAEEAITYIKEFSTKANVNISDDIYVLETKLKAAKDLLTKGEYKDVVKLCKEIIESVKLLQIKVLKETESSFKEKLKEKFEEEKTIVKRKTYERLLAKLKEIAKRSNDTHLIDLIETIEEKLKKGEPGVEQEIIKVIKELRSKARKGVEEKAERMADEILREYGENLIEKLLKGKGNITRSLEIAIEKLKETIEKLKELLEHLKEVNASEKALATIEKIIERLNEVIGHLKSIQETVKKSAFNIHDLLNKTKEFFKKRYKKQSHEEESHKHSLPIEIKKIKLPKRISINKTITITLVLKSNLNKSIDINIVILDEDGNALLNETKTIPAYTEVELSFNLTLSLTKTICKLKLIIKYDDKVIEKSLNLTVTRRHRMHDL